MCLRKGGGGLLSLCSLISPDSSESAAKTLRSTALHLPLHHDHFLFTTRPLTAYWCLLDSASFFPLSLRYSSSLWFAVEWCMMIGSHLYFSPLLHAAIVAKTSRGERNGVNNKPRQHYLMDQFVINLLPRAVERVSPAKVTAFFHPEHGGLDKVDRYINAFNEPTGSGMQENVVKASNSLIKTRFSLFYH